MAQTYVQLGGITFADLEVPEVISWGGDQALSVQKLIGGARVIDAMGRDDAPITWSGIFMGSSAFDRAQYLNSSRVAGQQLELSWGGLDFTVVIKSFRADYRLNVYIPYEITVEIVTDNVTSTSPNLPPDVDMQMDTDMNSASALGGNIGDATLSGLMSTLNTAVSAVGTFANATQATIAGVMNPLAAVQGRVTTLLNAAQIIASGVTTPGGVLPGAPLSQNVAALTAQLASFQEQANCVQLQGFCGRMAHNTVSIGTNATSITVGGGNLFALASKYYKNQDAWTGIANANGLSDPQLSGINTLTIPALPDRKSGGVLGVS